MSRARVGVYLGVAILVVALSWGRGLDAGERPNAGGRGYLIRNASVVLTMDPTLGHGILGQIENADVLIVGDKIAAVGSLERRPRGVQVIESPDKKDGDSFQILKDAGALALGRDLLFAHVIHLSPADLAKLVETGAAVSHQPLSNMRLASGIMRYPEMQGAGIRIGLGLDGGTNDTVDVFNNMRAAVGLQRALAAGPLTSPTVEQVLRAATMGGAEVLDMQGTIGSLTPGKQADVIVIDTRAVNFAPVLRPVAQLVFNGQPQNVQWVFVAGRALMENGKVKGVNERKLIEEAQARATGSRACTCSSRDA